MIVRFVLFRPAIICVAAVSPIFRMMALGLPSRFGGGAFKEVSDDEVLVSAISCIWLLSLLI